MVCAVRPPTEGDAVIRLAARVVWLDPDHRVLLFAGSEVGGPRSVVWYLPGGGVEPGETTADAARRELWEEAGVSDLDLGPCVWTRRRMRSDGVDSRSEFFLVRAPSFEFDVSAVPMPGEVDEYRWWTLDEIADAGHETFIPKRLEELLAPLVRGLVPDAPVDASD